MDENMTAVIAPFKETYRDENFKGLKRIFKYNDFSCNVLIENTLQILMLLNNNDKLLGVKYDFLVDYFSREVGVSLEQIKSIFTFLMEQHYLSASKTGISLTQEGKLFSFRDRSAVSSDMLRYYWEEADWSFLSGIKEYNKLIQKDARKYLALLFMYNNRINDKFPDGWGFYLSVSRDIISLLESKTMRYIIKYVLEPMGIVVASEISGKLHVTNTEGGQKIFEYYCRDILEEYSKLVDECWECYDRGNFEQAYDIAKGIVGVVPDNLEAYNVIGCVYIKKKEYRKAIDTFQFALNIYETSLKFNARQNNTTKDVNMDAYISLYHNLALCYFYMGDLINSLRIFRYIKKNVPYSLKNIEDLISGIKKTVVIIPMKNS